MGIRGVRAIVARTKWLAVSVAALAAAAAANAESVDRAADPGSETALADTASPVRLSHDLVDFGVLDPGESVETAVAVANTGSLPIAIVQVQSSCACTAALVGADLLEAGQSTEIRVAATASLHAGEYDERLRIVTTASNEPIEVVIRWRVAPSVETRGVFPVGFEPERRIVDFGYVDGGSTGEFELSLKNIAAESLAILRTASTCGCAAAVRTEDSVGPGETLSVHLTMTAPTMAGVQERKQVVLFPSDGYAPVQIEVRITSRPIARAEVLELIDEGGRLTGRLRVTALGSAPLRIVRSHPFGAVEPSDVGFDQYESDFSIAADNRGQFPRTLAIELDHPRQPLLRIDIVRLLAELAPSTPIRERFQRTTLRASTPRLSFGALPPDAGAVNDVVIRGWPSGVEPDLIWSSPRAAIELESAQHHPDGLHLRLRLFRIDRRPGRVLGTLTIECDTHFAVIDVAARL